jgi:hypothetical protein
MCASPSGRLFGPYDRSLHGRAHQTVLPRTGTGVDTALLSNLAAISAERGYRHMQWWGRVTNDQVAAYYRSLGAEIPSVQGEELTIFRLSGAPLPDLARQA